MISIADIINFLETKAPLALQESYDNAGLVCGNRITHNSYCYGLCNSDLWRICKDHWSK